jgi:hypothetical protein
VLRVGITLTRQVLRLATVEAEGCYIVRVLEHQPPGRYSITLSSLLQDKLTGSVTIWGQAIHAFRAIMGSGVEASLARTAELLARAYRLSPQRLILQNYPNLAWKACLLANLGLQPGQTTDFRSSVGCPLGHLC